MAESREIVIASTATEASVEAALDAAFRKVAGVAPTGGARDFAARKWNEVQRRRLLALRREGMSWAEVAGAFGVTIQAARSQGAIARKQGLR